ncbi:MAG: hypothetical protein AABY33_06165 [Pseudomonadota bacterium]
MADRKDILVISDYEKSSSIMKKLLSAKGYKAEVLKSTSAPIERINDTEKKPDLIIIDKSVEGFNEILKETKKANIPVIALMAKDETKNVAATIGVIVIRKPITNNDEFLSFIKKEINKQEFASSRGGRGSV